MRYLIRHQTRLLFPELVREHHCELRLVPREGETQHVLEASVAVEPEASLRSYVDGFGNRVHYFAVLSAHDSLVTRIEAVVETHLENPFAYDPVPVPREVAWIADALRTHPPLWDYVLHHSPYTPDLAGRATELGLPARLDGAPLVESVQLATTWVGDLLQYESGSSAVDTPLDAVLERRAGVCQDFAHLLVSIVRTWGIPARYVMGYVDPGYHDEDTAAATEATHAWAEVLIPGAGWRGFDPVHRLIANDTYVPVAVGRDYRDAAPQRGTFTGASAGASPDVELHVARQQQ